MNHEELAGCLVLVAISGAVLLWWLSWIDGARQVIRLAREDAALQQRWTLANDPPPRDIFEALQRGPLCEWPPGENRPPAPDEIRELLRGPTGPCHYR